MLLKKLLLILLVMQAINAVAQMPLSKPEEVLEIFLNSSNDNEKANMAFAMGEYFWERRKLPKAKHWYHTSLNIMPRATDSNNVVNALHLLANVYLNEAEYDSALFYCDKSFAAIGQINNKKLLPNLYQTKGRI